MYELFTLSFPFLCGVPPLRARHLPSLPAFASRDHKSSSVGISLSGHVCCKCSCLPCVPVVLVRKLLVIGKGCFLHHFKRKKGCKIAFLIAAHFLTPPPFVFC